MNARRRALSLAAAAGMSLLVPACRRENARNEPRAAPHSEGLRLELRHVAQGGDERFELVTLTREPAAPSTRGDTSDWGDYTLVVEDAVTHDPLVRAGFDSNIDAAAAGATTLLSLRCAMPSRAFTYRIAKRRPGGVFETLLNGAGDASIVRDAAMPAVHVETLMLNGEPEHKADLAIVGDGYSAGERSKFLEHAKRAAGYVFFVEPYRSRRRDFNVHAVFLESAESGVGDDYLARRATSALRSSYGGGANERTLSVADERGLRDAACAVPYDFLLVLANAGRYGGSAYYGGPAVVAIDSGAARYLVLHELGHAIAGLAEEYYIPEYGGPAYRGNVEPWNANVTATLQTRKWSAPAAAPTAWNKAQYERYFANYVRRYDALRAGGESEAKVEKLMREAAARQAVLLGRSREVGLFEGANGYASGMYRSEADCIMFSLQTEYYCAACGAALNRAIDACLQR